MKVKFLKKGVMLGTAVLLSQMALTAQAQPDLNEAPKGDNPIVNQRPKKNGNNADAAIRKMLVQGGVADIATQDAVLAFVKEDTEARRPMREQGAKLFQALRAGAITDEQFLALVTDYRAAQQAEKVRREEAQDALDEKIHFTDNPRLEAMLLLAGLIGDGVPFMNGGQAGFNVRGGQFGQNAMAKGENAQKREENRKKMTERFDKNADGKLDVDETAAWKQWRQERKEKRQDKADQAPAAALGIPAPPADEAMADEAIANNLNA